jgi:hypothetical protein
MNRTLEEIFVKFSRFSTLSAIVAANALCVATSSAQQPAGAESRTQAIVASFNKSKHVVKEKRGVRKEKYLDVRSVPAVRESAADYSGEYEAQGLGFSLRLRADRSGKVEGSGYEPLNEDATTSRTFTLTNGRIAGALITATKVYGDGSSHALEGVFIDKTTFESPTDKGVTTFGLGVVGTGIRVNGLDLGRVFYQLKD